VLERPILTAAATNVAPLSAGVKTNDPIAEKKYWDQVHQRQLKEKEQRERQELEGRAHVSETVADLVAAGQSARPPELEIPDFDEGYHQFSPPDPFSDESMLWLAFGLMALVTVKALTRHKREAVARELAGTYICDGVEAAYLQMPFLSDLKGPADESVADKQEEAAKVE